MNTSMTINATAPWLLALYLAVAEEQGAPIAALQGTTQNDIIKEYLSRGTYVFPPAPSLRLTKDVILFTTKEVPKWNPMNVCSYHLQEAGATPVQELSYALAIAIAVLDTVREDPNFDEASFSDVFSRISFFVNAGMRFVTEICKMRAFAELWDEIAQERYGITDAKKRIFRYGVQVNSLGLTEQQPENNVHRILIEMLAVTLSKRARARAVQLPAWNEALGLPRPWDQQWSMRMQQILAFETDLLEYDDIFDGSHVIEKRVEELKAQTRAELERIGGIGGAVAAVETGALKRALVESNAKRISAIEAGDQIVVGVNKWQQGEPSPLTAGEGAIFSVSETVEMEAANRIKAWREQRDDVAVKAALDALEEAARSGTNIMPASIAAAKAGVTTGEWGGRLRQVFGEYRAPTGVTVETASSGAADEARLLIADLGERLGEQPSSSSASGASTAIPTARSRLRCAPRDVGFDVTYDGIRQTPSEIVAKAKETGAHVVGLSILSGSHVPLVREVRAMMREAGSITFRSSSAASSPGGRTGAQEHGRAGRLHAEDYAIDRIMIDLGKVIEKSLDAKANRPQRNRLRSTERFTSPSRPIISLRHRDSRRGGGGGTHGAVVDRCGGGRSRHSATHGSARFRPAEAASGRRAPTAPFQKTFAPEPRERCRPPGSEPQGRGGTNLPPATQSPPQG